MLSHDHSSTRRQFLAQGAALCAAATGVAHAQPAAPPPRYNIVVLMSDEHNPRFCGPMGHPLAGTPQLQRMAARGTVFERAYCPSPLCAPSRASFLSGLRAHQHQQYNNCNVFPQAHATYAEALRAAGVHTVHAGKSDFYRPAADCGFAEVLLPGDRAMPGDRSISRDPLFVREGEGAARGKAFGPAENPYAGDDAIAGVALDWLEHKAPALDRPFSLVVNITRPHFPHKVRPDQWERFAAGADLPVHGKEAMTAQHPYAQDHRRHFETDVMTEEQIRGHRRSYLGCVEYVDEVVGRFIELLERTGLAENTVFLYTSDHGEMLGRFGMWWKCSLFEDSVRVPLLAMGPGFEQGTRVHTPVDLLDVQATIFRATGAARPAAWHGQPLQDIPANDPQRVVFSEYHGHGARGSSYLVRQGDWKYLWYAGAPEQLFNLREDPEELQNQAESMPAQREALLALLRAHCDPEAEHRRAEAFIQSQLKALAAATG